MEVITHRYYCIRCKSKTEPLLKNCRKPSGIQYYMCRTCVNNKQKKYYSTPVGKEKQLEINKRTIMKFPEKRKAREVLARAIKAGKVDKPEICEDCSSKVNRIEGHHSDYAKPLEVKWLCTSCHRSHHRMVSV